MFSAAEDGGEKARTSSASVKGATPFQLFRELFVPGSSLIVSDQGNSYETGTGTEFIVRPADRRHIWPRRRNHFAWAVVRLITSSTLIGRSRGISPNFAPQDFVDKIVYTRDGPP
jgi:hypothetical protein